MERHTSPSSGLPERRIVFGILPKVRSGQLTSKDLLEILGQNPEISVFELFDSVANRPGYFKCARDMVGALLEHIWKDC